MCKKKREKNPQGTTGRGRGVREKKPGKKLISTPPTPLPARYQCRWLSLKFKWQGEKNKTDKKRETSDLGVRWVGAEKKTCHLCISAL